MLLGEDLRDTIGESWLRSSDNGGGADENFDPDWSTINLDALKRSGRLVGLVGLAEDDSGTA
jgi:hypothetical protein